MAWGDCIAKIDGKARCGLQGQDKYHLKLAFAKNMLLICASGKLFSIHP
jgi:hypothetical protein